MSSQGIVSGGNGCTPLPLPENTLTVNNGDDCSSYSTLTAAIGALTMDGQTIYVESDTSEVGSLAVQIQYDVNIIGIHGKVVSMTDDIVFEIISGKIVKLYQMTFSSDGTNDIFLMTDGNLHVLDGTTLQIPSPLAGSYSVRMNNATAELYVENSYLLNAGNTNINLDNGAVISIQKSKFEALDRNVEGAEPVGMDIDIQDSQFIVDSAGGRNNLLFNQIPQAQSRIVRNTFDNSPTLPSIKANIWNNAKISQNTFIDNGGGAIDGLITVAAGATNDII